MNLKAGDLMDFEPIEDYNGDMVLINRLAEFYADREMSWNSGEIVNLNNISCAICHMQSEEAEPYGDTWKYPCKENKSTNWHIGRIIYFINHPEEIKDIEIDNMCNGMYICPIPIIVDGHHRFMAAMWLNSQGKMDKIHCMYGGREDVLDYLTGNIDKCPVE